MKKIIAAAMALVAVMTGCAQGKQSNQASDEMNNTNKTLVAYFSATGTTKAVGEKLARLTGATLFEIKPEQPYTAADLDWTNDSSRSSVEMKDKEHSRPAVADKVENIAQFDTIFVGFPIWWYTCPTIINTFLESYDLNGKTIIPFATSGSSPIEPSAPDIEKSAPGANVKPGKLLNHATDADVQRWLGEL